MKVFVFSQTSPHRLLVPVRSAGGTWSLVETSSFQRTVTHYIPCGGGRADDTTIHSITAGCGICQDIANLSDRSAEIGNGTRRGPTAWQFDVEVIQADDDPGLYVLWLLQLREFGGTVVGSPPADMRLRLAREMIDELTRSTAILSPTDSDEEDDVTRSPVIPSSETEILDRWAVLERQGYGGLTDALRQVAQRWGWTESDRLFQLAFNIGSPPVFLALKQEFAQLRLQRASEPNWSLPHKARLYGALLRLETNDRMTQTGLRLGYWNIAHLCERKKAVDCSNPLQTVIEDQAWEKGYSNENS